MNKQQKLRMMRTISFICWFVALYLLFDNYQSRKMKEAEEAKQNAVVMEMEEQKQTGEDWESTVIFPTED